MGQTDKEKPIYVDERKVAEIIGCSLAKLRNDRHLRRGIPYYKIGGLARYRLDEVYENMESHRITF